MWATIDATASDKAWISLSLCKSTAPAMPHISGLLNDLRCGQKGGGQTVSSADMNVFE